MPYTAPVSGLATSSSDRTSVSRLSRKPPTVHWNGLSLVELRRSSCTQLLSDCGWYSADDCSGTVALKYPVSWSALHCVVFAAEVMPRR